jgi:hypothetical protein
MKSEKQDTLYLGGGGDSMTLSEHSKFRSLIPALKAVWT